MEVCVPTGTSSNSIILGKDEWYGNDFFSLIRGWVVFRREREREEGVWAAFVHVTTVCLGEALC